MMKPDFPCPLAPIYAAPTLATAPGPVYRAAIVLALAYWRAGCQLPADDDVTLASLCRVPAAHLRPHKPSILQALSEMRPALDREHARQIRLHKHRTAAAQRMRDGKASRRAAMTLQQGGGQTSLAPLALPHRGQSGTRWRHAETPPGPPKHAGASVGFID